MPRGSQRKPTHQPTSSQPQDIDPRWLLKALGIVLGVALLCGYLTLCGLFYQGQWQFVLHPDTTVKATPASASLPFEDVHFDFTETGQAQLRGWWIPAAANAHYSSVTVLYLHGGNGSLADTLPHLQELHALGLNVFAFDYHGFGQSAGPHPNEQRMREDAAAAWLYVAHNRMVPATLVVLYGEGVGNALAVQLLTDHPRVPAVIFDRPIFDLPAQVSRDSRSHLIPVRLLLRERFAVARPLATLHTPKLLLLDDGPQSPAPTDLKAVADPKLVLHLGGLSVNDTAMQRNQFLSRFLDEYLPVASLTPQ